MSRQSPGVAPDRLVALLAARRATETVADLTAGFGLMWRLGRGTPPMYEIQKILGWLAGRDHRRQVDDLLEEAYEADAAGHHERAKYLMFTAGLAERAS